MNNLKAYSNSYSLYQIHPHIVPNQLQKLIRPAVSKNGNTQLMSSTILYRSNFYWKELSFRTFTKYTFLIKKIVWKMQMIHWFKYYYLIMSKFCLNKKNINYFHQDIGLLNYTYWNFIAIHETKILKINIQASN